MSSNIGLWINAFLVIIFGVVFMSMPNSFFRAQSKFLKKITPKWWYNIYEKNDIKEQAKNYNSKIIAGVIMIIFGLWLMYLTYSLYFGK